MRRVWGDYLGGAGLGAMGGGCGCTQGVVEAEEEGCAAGSGAAEGEGWRAKALGAVAWGLRRE